MFWRNTGEPAPSTGSEVRPTPVHDGTGEFVRPSVTVHIGVELIPPALLRGLLAEGGTITPFDPKKGYVAKTMVPPAGTALSTVTRHPSVLVGVSLLQERDHSGIEVSGYITSLVRLTEPTDWMRVGNMTEALRTRTGMKRDEPVYARIKPPNPREYGVAECIVEFKNRCEAQLSEIAGSVGADGTARLVFQPLTEGDRIYLDGLKAYPEMLALLDQLGVDMVPVRQEPVPRLVSPVLPANRSRLPPPALVPLAPPSAAE
jgi:hypothetical protein